MILFFWCETQSSQPLCLKEGFRKSKEKISYFSSAIYLMYQISVYQRLNGDHVFTDVAETTPL